MNKITFEQFKQNNIFVILQTEEERQMFIEWLKYHEPKNNIGNHALTFVKYDFTYSTLQSVDVENGNEGYQLVSVYQLEPIPTVKKLTMKQIAEKFECDRVEIVEE